MALVRSVCVFIMVVMLYVMAVIADVTMYAAVVLAVVYSQLDVIQFQYNLPDKFKRPNQN